MFARGTTATASFHEMSYAELDGAEFIYGKSIPRITEEGPVFADSIQDEEGHVVGISEKEELVPADSVIIAISQGPKDKLIMSTDHLLANSKGLLITDENCMTTVDGVFAAGDVVTGSLTVVHAAEAAKRAAEAMMKYMEKEDSPAEA